LPALASYPLDFRVTNRIGGAADSANWVFDSSLTYGQSDSSTCLAANFMANAKQVGNPHSLQFVLGSNLYICIPDKAIFASLNDRWSAGLIKCFSLQQLSPSQFDV
jgi:hypothetical protein